MKIVNKPEINDGTGIKQVIVFFTFVTEIDNADPEWDCLVF